MPNKKNDSNELRIRAAIAFLIVFAAIIASLVWVNTFNIYLAGEMSYLTFFVISLIAIALAIGGICVMGKLCKYTED